MILRGIAEVAEELGLQQHVLRFWETEFKYLQPIRRNGRRYYRAEDLETLRGVQVLLHERGLTLDGLRLVFRERGLAFVRAIGVSRIEGDHLDLVAATVTIADLPLDQQAALIETLTDPTSCRALADACLARGHPSAESSPADKISPRCE